VVTFFQPNKEDAKSMDVTIFLANDSPHEVLQDGENIMLYVSYMCMLSVL